MTRFDNADLDRLFALLGSDLPDDRFDAQLHAALVAESVPVARSRWKRWGRVGAGVALAAIPLAAAAAVGGGWTTAWTSGENAEGHGDATAPGPAKEQLSLPLRPRPTIVSLAAASTARQVSHPQPIATRTEARARDDQNGAKTSAASEMRARHEPPPLAASALPVALDTPRVERVQLAPAHAGPTNAEADPPGVGTATPPASSTPERAGAQRGPAHREERERARESRRRDAAAARERRRAGPRSDR